MLGRAVVSAATAFGTIVLMLAAGKLEPALGNLAILPGGWLAMALISMLDFAGALPSLGDEGPVVSGGLTLLLSFAFWWAVIFAIVPRRQERGGHS
jgi:hypothetical protein